MIMKYKLIDGKIPNNIIDGGYFEQGDILIGQGKEVEYEVITKQELIDLVLAQHHAKPFERENIVFSDAEVISIVENWCVERNEV